MEELKIFKTEKREKREERDLAICAEYKQLMAQPVHGQSKTLIIQYLMKKHNLRSLGSFYVIRRRVEAMLARKEAIL